MKVKINKPARVNILSGEVDVSPQEYNRLVLLNLIAKVEERTMPEENSPREAPEKPRARKK